jgi:hypothetical protein
VTTYKELIQGRQVILLQPTDLPDGKEVEIIPVDHSEPTDHDGPVTPEEIAPGAGAQVLGRLPCRPRPGPHPGDQAPADQESISI